MDSFGQRPARPGPVPAGPAGRGWELVVLAGDPVRGSEGDRKAAGGLRRGAVLLLILVLGLAGILVLGRAMVVPVPAVSFTLHDQHGREITLADWRGRPVLLTFLYTHCPSVCPRLITDLQATVALLAEQGAVQPVLAAVTVDPARDTVDHLAGFAAGLDREWHLLTGPAGRLRQVWREYGIYVARVEAGGDHAAHQGYLVEHSVKILLIDEEGNLRAVWRGEVEPAALARAVAAAGAGDPLPRTMAVSVWLDGLLYWVGVCERILNPSLPAAVWALGRNTLVVLGIFAAIWRLWR